MNFRWGLDAEAAIYCQSSKTGLNMQLGYVNNFVSQMSVAMRNDGMLDLSYRDLVEKICDLVEVFSTKQGWTLTDEDGASWFIGLLSKTYLALPGNKATTYDSLFVDCFKCYFSRR